MNITLADQNRDMLNAFGKLFAARGYPNQTAFDGTQVLRRPSASAAERLGGRVSAKAANGIYTFRIKL